MIKPRFFQIPKTGRESFRYQWDQLPHFYDRYHFHPEIQIVSIIQGEGELLISGHQFPFSPGSVFIIGANIPHWFRSHAVYFQSNPNYICESMSFFLHPELFGGRLENFPELQELARFTQSGFVGFEVIGELANQVSSTFRDARDRLPEPQLITIIHCWSTIYQSSFKVQMAKMSPHQLLRKEERLTGIITWLMDNFNRPITLNEVSELAHLTPEALCRYFKSHTGKTISQWLTELRIEKAGRLLMETDQAIASIAVQCGYESLSNFNRQFKQVTGRTPREMKAIQHQTVTPRNQVRKKGVLGVDNL